MSEELKVKHDAYKDDSSCIGQLYMANMDLMTQLAEAKELIRFNRMLMNKLSCVVHEDMLNRLAYQCLRNYKNKRTEWYEAVYRYCKEFLYFDDKRWAWASRCWTSRSKSVDEGTPQEKES